MIIYVITFMLSIVGILLSIVTIKHSIEIRNIKKQRQQQEKRQL